MQRLSSWIDQLSYRWKAAVLIVAIFSAGLTTGAAAGGFTKLPARVVALEQRADQFNKQLEDLGRDVSAIRKANRQMLCLTMAERAHTDWRKCVE